MFIEVAAGIGRAAGEDERVLAVAPGLHLPLNSRFRRGSRPSTNAAVFLDRDGVIVRDVHYLRTASQIDLLADVATLRSLMDTFYLVVVTNQSGIARGFLTENDLLEIHKDLVGRLESLGVVIDAFYYCPHLDVATVAAYRMSCDCRKPAPGMLVRARTDWGIDLGKSYMIGDTTRDIQAGIAAGLGKNILLGENAVDISRAIRDILALHPEQSGAETS